MASLKNAVLVCLLVVVVDVSAMWRFPLDLSQPNNILSGLPFSGGSQVRSLGSSLLRSPNLGNMQSAFSNIQQQVPGGFLNRLSSVPNIISNTNSFTRPGISSLLNMGQSAPTGIGNILSRNSLPQGISRFFSSNTPSVSGFPSRQNFNQILSGVSNPFRRSRQQTSGISNILNQPGLSNMFSSISPRILSSLPQQGVFNRNGLSNILPGGTSSLSGIGSALGMERGSFSNALSSEPSTILQPRNALSRILPTGSSSSLSGITDALNSGRSANIFTSGSPSISAPLSGLSRVLSSGGLSNALSSVGTQSQTPGLGSMLTRGVSNMFSSGSQGSTPLSGITGLVRDRLSGMFKP